MYFFIPYHVSFQILRILIKYILHEHVFTVVLKNGLFLEKSEKSFVREKGE